jgi:hypothetical protein
MPCPFVWPGVKTIPASRNAGGCARPGRCSGDSLLTTVPGEWLMMEPVVPMVGDANLRVLVLSVAMVDRRWTSMSGDPLNSAGILTICKL